MAMKVKPMSKPRSSKEIVAPMLTLGFTPRHKIFKNKTIYYKSSAAVSNLMIEDICIIAEL
jgi:hypothetical protein